MQLALLRPEFIDQPRGTRDVSISSSGLIFSRETVIEQVRFVYTNVLNFDYLLADLDTDPRNAVLLRLRN